MRLFGGLGLGPALFALGALSAPPTSPPTRVAIPAAGAQVPMQRIQGLPAVDVSINGAAPYRFVVDWGANLLAVSPRVAGELKLPEIGTDAMGNRSVRIDSLAVGGARFEGLTAAVDSFFADKQEQGVLGVNVYTDILLTLDYPRGIVRLEKGSLPLADGKRILACRPADGPEPAIEIALAGKPITVLLDTGARRLVMLPERWMADLPLFAAPAPAGTAGGPQAGAARLKEARLRGDLNLGAFRVRDPLLTFHARPRAFLGGALLESFAVTLDQKGQRVRFARDSEAPIVVPAVP
jgi:predicted aspartyl protease